jgi:hypothetical protein
VNNLKDEIYHLVNLLIHPGEGKGYEVLSELIAEDFREISSSGGVYTKRDILANLKKLSGFKINITDFEVMPLSENSVLATYKLTKSKDNKTSKSLRSAIWKNNEGKWQMSFHQATKVK